MSALMAHFKHHFTHQLATPWASKDKRGQGAMLLALAEAQLAKALAGEALSHWTAGIVWVMGCHGHKDR